ncbi:hypothetical protein [Hyphomicrobium methylovorum]|uniref:hypothetical protein n=1 Tax=Hyphomicrobium methylovorum TaxID=84 RepID=UPI0015E72440|nr:hypothetical protein [Hyphomicrobium methylovorum]
MYDENNYEDTAQQDSLMYSSISAIKAYKFAPYLWLEIADIASGLSGNKSLEPRLRRLLARIAEDVEDAGTLLSGDTPEEWDEQCRLEALGDEVRAAKAALRDALGAAKIAKKKPKTVTNANHISAQSHSVKSKAPLKKKERQTATPSIKKKPKQTTAAIAKVKKSTRRKPAQNKRAKKQRR